MSGIIGGLGGIGPLSGLDDLSGLDGLSGLIHGWGGIIDAFGEVGGLGSTLTTDALIAHRDGIVGEWKGPTMHPQPRPIDAPRHLRLWESTVRAALFDFDLASHLHVSSQPTAEKDPVPDPGPPITLWHVEHAAGAAPAASYSPLLTVSRPGRAKLEEQLEYVQQWSDLRQDRASEILSQMVPPVAFWTAIANLHPSRTPRTLELLYVALRLALLCEMRIKHALAVRRPVEHSPQLQPVIQTPGHASFPSGHSTEAHMGAFVIYSLINPGAGSLMGEQLMRQAARIAINRQVAGMHFPVDTACGQVLGLTLARYFVARCTGGNAINAWKFEGNAFDGEYRRDALFDVGSWAQVATGYSTRIDPSYTPARSAVLGWLWDEAKQEWS